MRGFTLLNTIEGREMQVQLTSIKNGKTIHNHTYAHESTGVNFDALVIIDLDNKFTPLTVNGFTDWVHSTGITGKSTYFCKTK